MPGLRCWVLAPFNQQRLVRGQTSSSGEGGYPGIPASTKEQTRVTGVLARVGCFLNRGEGREHQRIWREEPLGWSAHPLLLLPEPQMWQLVCSLFVSYCS